MDIKIRFSKTEVKDIIREYTVRVFGVPPTGMKWDVEDLYGEYEVVTVELPQPEPAEAAEAGPVTPPPVKTDQPQPVDDKIPF